MTAALNIAALTIAAVTGLLWLYLDHREQRRRRRWERHTQQALHLISPNHPSVRGDE